MVRLALLPLLLAMASPITRADEAKGEKIAYTRYADYFEKNTSGLEGDDSIEAFPTKEAFEKVFGLRPPLMGGKKSVAVPNDDFGKKAVFAIIKRGPSIPTYTIEKVTLDKDTMYVQLKVEYGKPGTAKFATPLILTADKGKAKKVVFIENGMNIGGADLK
jgi:hypothetical protein